MDLICPILNNVKHALHERPPLGNETLGGSLDRASPLFEVLFTA